MEDMTKNMEENTVEEAAEEVTEETVTEEVSEEEVEVEVPVVDEEGNPVYDEEGNQLVEIVTELQTVTHEAQTYSVFIPDDSAVSNAIKMIKEIINER